MRNIVFKDPTISESEYQKLLAEYIDFLKENAGLSPYFVTESYDFTNYPTIIDADGDDRPTDKFLNSFKDVVIQKYGDYGTDNIILLIHEDNWKSGRTETRRGIWGTNYSYNYGPYHVQYCMWNRKSLANSFGTLNHEHDHTYDALIKVELGININPILGVTNYDKHTTHGVDPAYHPYIRYKENAAKLKVLAPYLQSAYQKRLERHTKAVAGRVESLQKQIISLLEKLVYQLQTNLNKKNGNPQ